MANKTPFQLTAMAGTDLATDDVLLIGDLSATGTKQIDLSEAFATQAIAEAGTNETRFMNPLRVAQAIAAQVTIPEPTAWEKVEDTYDFAVDGAVGSVESAAFEDGYEYAFDINNLSNSGGGAVYLQFYREADAAYTTSAQIYTMGGIGEESVGWIELSNSRQSTKVKSAVGAVHYASSITLDAGVALTVPIAAFTRLTTAQKVGKVKFLSSGSFDSGVITMYRRGTL